MDWTGSKRFGVPVSQFNLELTAVTTGPKPGALLVDDVTPPYESGPVIAADFETPQRNPRLCMLGAPETTPSPSPPPAAPASTNISQLPDGSLCIEGVTFTDTFRLASSAFRASTA